MAEEKLHKKFRGFEKLIGKKIVGIGMNSINVVVLELEGGKILEVDAEIDGPCGLPILRLYDQRMHTGSVYRHPHGLPNAQPMPVTALVPEAKKKPKKGVSIDQIMTLSPNLGYPTDEKPLFEVLISFYMKETGSTRNEALAYAIRFTSQLNQDVKALQK